MAYEKRVCVLKQLKRGFTADGSGLSGAVYCERLGSELTVTPRILGIAPIAEGRYVLVIRAEERTLVLELKGNEALHVPNAPSVKNGFSALLCFVRGEAEPLAFGACGAAGLSYTPLLAALSEVDKGKKKTVSAGETPDMPPSDFIETEKQGENEGDESAALPFREGAVYDDEAIASADYYAGGDAHEKGGGGGRNEAEKVAGGAHSFEDAPDLVARPRGSLTYYKEVRERLQEALKKYPADERLKGAFPQSEWVLSEVALLGVIYEEGLPRYLCVAVENTGEPPEEMKDVCALVPAAPASDVTFWVVFQDADTGDYVRVYDT